MYPKLVLLAVFLPISVVFAQSQAPAPIDSLLQELSKKSEDTSKVILLNDLAFRYADIDPDEGIRYGRQAIALSKELEWQKGLATAHAMVGINYKAMSDYSAALEYEMKALHLYEDMGRPGGVSAMLSNISLIYMAQSDYPSALDYSFRALRMHEEAGDKGRSAIVMENIGIIYFRLQNYTKAMEYHNQAGAIYNELGNRVGLARNKGNIGNVLNEQQQYEKALEYHMDALRINEELNRKMPAQINHVNIGNAKLNMGEYASALQHQYMALEISEELGNKGSTATTLGNIGITHLRMATSGYLHYREERMPAGEAENLERAISYLENAITQCRELGYYDPVIEFHRELSTAYELAGDHSKALENYRQSVAVRDSIHSIQNQQRIANLETKRELELRDKDLELKDKQLRIQQLEIKQQRTKISLYLLAIILLAIITIVIWQQRAKYRRSHRTLTQENEEQLKQIESQMGALKQHSKVLQEIAYMQAHDVRGPVAALLGLTQLFNQHDLTDPKNKVIIGHIEEVTQKLDKAVREVIRKESEVNR